MTPVRWLRVLLIFVAVFHLIAGAGLMFSAPFQRFAAAAYGATLPWDARDTYFTRIIGSFAFALGYLAAMSARNPLRYRFVVVGFILFFVLRNVHRYLYSHELYAGFGVSSLVNDLTTAFFGLQALLLAVLLWQATQTAGGRAGARRPPRDVA